MPIDLCCRTCDSIFEAASDAIGSAVTCPHCYARFVARDSVKPGERTRRALAENEPSRRRASRRARRQKSGSTPVLLAILVPLILLIGVGLYFVGKWVKKDDANQLHSEEPKSTAKQSPAAVWERVEEPGKFRISMPTKPEKEIDHVPGGELIQYRVRKSDQVFMAQFASVHPDNLRLPHQMALNAVVDAFLQNSENKEIRSEWISLRGFPGKQVLVESRSNLKLRAMLRVYLANGFMYLVLAGGDGFSPDHSEINRYFNSFELLGSNNLIPVNQKQDPVPQPQNPSSPEIQRMLVGTWKVRVGPTYEAEWTFHADGSCDTTVGTWKRGVWKIQEDRQRVYITWNGDPVWDTFALPLDPKGTTGLTWNNAAWRVHAVKIR